MSTGYQSTGSLSNQFEQINGNISSNIYKIKQNNTELVQQAKLIGTPKDTLPLRDRITNTIDETTKLITVTGNYFKQLNNKKWGKSENLIIDRSKKTLKTEVDQFQKISKDVSEKLHVPLPNDNSNQGRTLISFDDDESNERSRLLQEQKQSDLRMKLETVQERERRIQHIESDIIDVNSIMKELSSLVTEQSSIIDNISTNVESTHENVESGNEQLVQAAKYASKYRKKVLILVAIALIICAVLAIIIYFSIKK